MGEIKNMALENEAMKDRIAFLEEVVDQQRETIAHLENENRLLEAKIARKDLAIKGIKLNNSALTLERNNALDELSKIKAMNMYEFGAKYNTSEQQEEAGRAFARELLGR